MARSDTQPLSSHRRLLRGQSENTSPGKEDDSGKRLFAKKPLPGSFILRISPRHSKPMADEHSQNQSRSNDARSGMPAPADFSLQAVRRFVRNEAITHPATLYPGVFAVLGGLAWVLFGSPLFILGAFGAFLAGAAGFTVNYFFRDETLAKRYLEGLKEKMTAEDERRLADLHEELKNGVQIPGAEQVATTAVEQFVKVKLKYDNLNQLLEQKLGSGEINVGGLWAAGEQVYLGVLDNLRDVAAILRSVSTIDSDYIHGRLKELSRNSHRGESDPRERETLRKRMKLREQQLGKISELLTRNEEALTHLEEASAAVAEAEASDDLASVNPEISTTRLKELAAAIRGKNERIES